MLAMSRSHSPNVDIIPQHTFMMHLGVPRKIKNGRTISGVTRKQALHAFSAVLHEGARKSIVTITHSSPRCRTPFRSRWNRCKPLRTPAGGFDEKASTNNRGDATPHDKKSALVT